MVPLSTLAEQTCLFLVEHNIKAPAPSNGHPPRRPDLSTFFSTLDLVDTSGSRQPQNAHSLPLPRDISAAFRNLANAFEMMRGGHEGASAGDGHDELLETLVQSLMQNAEQPPTEVEGVSDEFIEQLERVPKKMLKADMSCPICANPFLEGTLSPCRCISCWHADHAQIRTLW